MLEQQHQLPLIDHTAFPYREQLEHVSVAFQELIQYIHRDREPIKHESLDIAKDERFLKKCKELRLVARCWCTLRDSC